MPNRILRDWTDSFTINALDAHVERFFVRLIMKADDFGRFHADTRLLKASLFPLLPDVRESDISRWLAECEKAGLLRVYVDGRSRNYLEIANFKQRTRQSESKFPSPDSENQAGVNRKPDDSPPIDGQVTVKGRSSDGQLRTYSETKTETKTETGKTNGGGDFALLAELNALSQAVAAAMGMPDVPEGKPGEAMRNAIEDFRLAGIVAEEVSEFVTEWHSRKMKSGQGPRVLLLRYLIQDLPGWVMARKIKSRPALKAVPAVCSVCQGTKTINKFDDKGWAGVADCPDCQPKREAA